MRLLCNLFRPIRFGRDGRRAAVQLDWKTRGKAKDDDERLVPADAKQLEVEYKYSLVPVPNLPEQGAKLCKLCAEDETVPESDKKYKHDPKRYGVHVEGQISLP